MERRYPGFEVPVNNALPVVALLFSATLWGLSWWPLKYFNQQGIDGVPLILVGYGSVAVALLPWLWRERRQWRRETGFVVLMVVLGGYANIAFAHAMIYGEVVRAMMLFYLAPVWGVLGGRLFLGERIDVVRGLGVFLALAGAFLVLGAWNLLSISPSLIDIIAVTAGLAFALNNVLCRAAQRVPIGTKAAAVFLGCGLMALAIQTFSGEPLPELPTNTWAWLLAFGLGWLLIATAATQWGVTHMEAGRASVILILELLVAVVSATLIGGEHLSPLELVGGGLIFLAALLEAMRTPGVAPHDTATCRPQERKPGR